MRTLATKSKYDRALQMREQGMLLKQIAPILGYRTARGVNSLLSRFGYVERKALKAMRIDLLANGKVIKSWYKKDIRGDYSTLGQMVYKQRMEKLIESLKSKVHFRDGIEYEFCKVYETY